ncbi:hypothetical protein Bca101_042823 [Brassica carinata]
MDLVAPAGPLLCGKPTLASTVPALCNVHFQKSQKLVVKTLKDAGHNVSSTSKPPPKLHVIVAAFGHHIQTKRKTHGVRETQKCCKRRKYKLSQAVSIFPERKLLHILKHGVTLLRTVIELVVISLLLNEDWLHMKQSLRQSMETTAWQLAGQAR